MDLKYIKHMMKEKGFTIATLADRLFISRSNLAKKMIGSRPLREFEALEICDVLDLTLKERKRVFSDKEGDKNGKA